MSKNNNISKDNRNTVEQLPTEALVDFALEHLGSENTELRQAALQEYLSRVENEPGVVSAPAGDVGLLRTKVAQVNQTAPT
jgi:hypothetical protein